MGEVEVVGMNCQHPWRGLRRYSTCKTKARCCLRRRGRKKEEEKKSWGKKAHRNYLQMTHKYIHTIERIG